MRTDLAKSVHILPFASATARWVRGPLTTHRRLVDEHVAGARSLEHGARDATAELRDPPARFKSQSEARMAVFEFVEGFYNSTIGGAVIRRSAISHPPNTNDAIMRA
jgi:hypothetical protein